jgi:Mor family transcriptional regulator
MRAKTKDRNREIFAGYRAGETTEQLAKTHGLACRSIIAILNVERHRLEVSVDEFYESLRSSSGLQPWIKL